MARLPFDDWTEVGGCALHCLALASLSQLVDGHFRLFRQSVSWPGGLVCLLLQFLRTPKAHSRVRHDAFSAWTHAR